MRRYMLHHRIVTYAMVLFLVLLTFILISVSRQVQDEQAMLLDSQARATTLSQAQRTCILGQPARLTYNGINSCYFGQYQSVSVRCNAGDQAKIIDASALGQRNNSCASQNVLQNAAYAYCGCPIPGAAVPPTAVPTRILQTIPIVANPMPGLSRCKKGINSFLTGDLCPSDDNLYLNASYVCHGGKKGTLGNKVDCYDSAQLISFARTTCAKESSCKFKLLTTPTVPVKSKLTPTDIPFPTSDPR